MACREIKPKTDTLCWFCSHACDNHCSWVRNAEPVDGWTAEKTIIRNNSGVAESYLVKDCPLFDRDSEGDKRGRPKDTQRVFARKKRNKISEYSLDALVTQILSSSVKDYIKAICMHDTRETANIKRFFRSSWFTWLSGIEDGKGFSEKLDNDIERFQTLTKNCYQRQFYSKQKTPQYSAFVCPICGGSVYSSKTKRNSCVCACYHCGARWGCG